MASLPPPVSGGGEGSEKDARSDKPELAEKDQARVESMGVDSKAEEEVGNGSREAEVGVEDEEEWDYYGPVPDLEDKFAGMKLHGEEEDELDLSGKVDELIGGVRWLGLF